MSRSKCYNKKSKKISELMLIFIFYLGQRSPCLYIPTTDTNVKELLESYV